MSAPVMTDEEVVFHIQKNTRLNQVRRVFNSAVGRIEQAEWKRIPPTAIELRRMEFEAVLKIAAELGVKL